MTPAEGLRGAFRDACKRTDELFAVVRPEALFDRPIPERHRLNFYIGHVEAFDWNMVCDHALGMDPIREDLNQLFAFGIDPDSDALPADGPADWPGLDETRTYCRRVRETVDAALDRVPEDVAQVCIEHRLMHAETICYLLHNLDPARKVLPADEIPEDWACREPAPTTQWIGIPAGRAELGREAGAEFGWDNEFGPHSVDVPAFEIAKHKVTNGEYLAFVEQGGEAPHYWERDEAGWRLRTMAGSVPLPLDWPVYATHVEARRFAQEAGAALPDEAQWTLAAYGSSNGSGRPPAREGGEILPRNGNFGFVRWDPCPVTATPGGDSPYGVSQLVGNGWEWTSDLLRPFPGFQEFPFYPGYSSNFFDDEHYVLKGASPRTAPALVRKTFRNWFREGYPYVYSTFRLARS